VQYSLDRRDKEEAAVPPPPARPPSSRRPGEAQPRTEDGSAGRFLKIQSEIENFRVKFEISEQNFQTSEPNLRFQSQIRNFRLEFKISSRPTRFQTEISNLVMKSRIPL
jgi:hypothetical protein